MDLTAAEVHGEKRKLDGRPKERGYFLLNTPFLIIWGVFPVKIIVAFGSEYYGEKIHMYFVALIGYIGYMSILWMSG